MAGIHQARDSIWVDALFHNPFNILLAKCVEEAGRRLHILNTFKFTFQFAFRGLVTHTVVALIISSKVTWFLN